MTRAKEETKKKTYWIKPSNIQKIERLAKKKKITGSNYLDNVVIPNL